MADQLLKQRIHDVLKEFYFTSIDDSVDVSDGDGDCIHVVIVSRKFDGKRMKEKDDMIWSALTEQLDKDQLRYISLTVGASPEEIKAG